MEDTNTAISALYHQTLYNLDFKDYSRDQLINLATLLNGNGSLGEFFGITERAFKEWNHSIDILNPHKYIEGEFKYPSIEENKVFQSFRLLNNFCLLEAKSQKDYEQVVKAGSIQKILIGFSSFLFKNEKTVKLIESNELTRVLIVNILQFLRRTIVNSHDWEPACLLYSENLLKLPEACVSQIITLLKQMLTQNLNSFTIPNLLSVIKNIVSIEEKLKLPSKEETFGCILNSLLKGVHAKNEEIKNFRFFDSLVSETSKVTKS